MASGKQSSYFLQFQLLLGILSISFLLHLAKSHPQQQSNLPGIVSLPTSTIKNQTCQRNEDCSKKIPDTFCKNGRTCECLKEFVEWEGKCYPRRVELDLDCEVDVQCNQGLGALSRCNKDTNRCQCYDVLNEGSASTAYYGNTCYYRLELGQKCDINEQCKASISPSSDTYCEVESRTCVCAEGKTCENVKGGVGNFKSSSGVVGTFVLIGLMAIKVIL